MLNTRDVLWLGNGTNITTPELVRIFGSDKTTNTVELRTKSDNTYKADAHTIRNIDRSQRLLILAYNQIIKSKEKEPYFNLFHYGEHFKQHFELLWMGSKPELVKVLNINSKDKIIQIILNNGELKEVSVEEIRKVTGVERYIIKSYRELIMIKLRSEIVGLFDKYYDSAAETKVTPKKPFNSRKQMRM